MGAALGRVLDPGVVVEQVLAAAAMQAAVRLPLGVVVGQAVAAAFTIWAVTVLAGFRFSPRKRRSTPKKRGRTRFREPWC